MARITIAIDDPALDGLGLPADQAAAAYLDLMAQGCVGPAVTGKVVSAKVTGLESDVVVLPRRPLRAAGRKAA